MVGSLSRIAATGRYSDRRLVDEVGDGSDDGFYAGLGFPTTASDDGESGVVSGGSRVVVTGKRVIEVDEGAVRKRVRIAPREVRGDGDEDSGDGGGGEEDEGDQVEVEGMEVDPGSESEEALKVPTTFGKGNPRRKFYFEDVYSSGDESDGEKSEEEPTALLTLRRQKEAANTIRRLKTAAAKDSSITVPEKKSRGKQLAVVNDPYRELLNEAIKDARTRTVYPDETFLASEICGVPWSSGEKGRFFRALPRVGRFNPVGLAEEVRTKSVIEVQGYLDVLKRELERRLAKNQRTRYELLLGEDIPAAVEVSEDCEKVLDEEAERTRGYMEKLEGKENKGKWEDGGDTVDLEMVREAGVREGNSVKEQLFDLETWLKLSERIFMAQAYDEKLGRPAIHRQTLEDLETLVTSVARRVIQIVLFQVNSRLEKLPVYGAPRRKITRKDILAALKMLGMPITSEEYWRCLSRKLQLRVLRTDGEVKRGEKPVFLEYDVVEEELKVFEDIGFYTDSILKGKNRQPKSGLEGEGWETDEEDEVNYVRGDPEEEEEWGDSQDDDSDEDEEDEDENEENAERGRMTASEMASYLDTPIHLESFLHAPPVKPLKPRQRKDILDELHYINKDEKYLNAVDKLHSKLEEKRMWKMLGGWKDRKETIEGEIKDADKCIPEEPNLRVFRRLERWKRDDWRQEAGSVVPIWRQEYYRKLLDQERVVRVKKESAKENERNISVSSEDDSVDSEGDGEEQNEDLSMSEEEDSESDSE
ncbi:hypothetical protein TWF281_010761 [Arthrobotrys megalospora]